MRGGKLDTSEQQNHKSKYYQNTSSIHNFAIVDTKGAFIDPQQKRGFKSRKLPINFKGAWCRGIDLPHQFTEQRSICYTFEVSAVVRKRLHSVFICRLSGDKNELGSLSTVSGCNHLSITRAEGRRYTHTCPTARIVSLPSLFMLRWLCLQHVHPTWPNCYLSYRQGLLQGLDSFLVHPPSVAHDIYVGIWAISGLLNQLWIGCATQVSYCSRKQNYSISLLHSHAWSFVGVVYIMTAGRRTVRERRIEGKE